MPDRLPTIRVFISSPEDVRPERLKAEQIIARLDREFAYRFRVEAVLWEREPLVATHHFQDEQNLLRPSRTDIVVVILWSRLGVLLPEDKFSGALSGRTVTGTEWEFEDALASAREHGVPDLLLYRKQAPPTAELHDRKALEERLAQLDLVDDFMGRWFRAEGGGYTAASHNFATATEFEEKLYEHLRELLERRAGAHVEGIEIHWHEAPFRGLLSFEFEHAPVFFGRARARNELRELLARREAAGGAFVLVLGASGSGKSSLVKAGLLPDLMLPGMIRQVGLVRWCQLRPSDAPDDLLDRLAAAILSETALPELSGLHYPQPEFAELLREAPTRAAVPIRQALAHAGRTARPPLAEHAEARLSIIVDQFEELFTIESVGQTAREAFVAALAALAKSGLVWVVATMRSDFFDRLETLPALAALSDDARFLLLPPDDAEVGQIIRLPAQEAGLRFEVDPDRAVGLDEVIRQAATAEKGALPLLSFLLDQMWQRRSDIGFLGFAAYEELGGLEGAVGHRAEEVLQDQPEPVQKELIALLRALVTVERGRAISRAAPLSLFPKGTPRRELVDALLDPGARLLVADGDAGGSQLRLAHEALLTHWPRARDQVAADARDLELRGRLEQAAEVWQTAPRRDKVRRVATGLILAEARALVTRWGAELPAEVREFVAASRGAARRRRLRLGAAVAGAMIALPAIAGIVWAGMVWSGVRTVEAEIEAEKAFVAIPVGCFDMGSSESDLDRASDEGPVHQVCVKAFDLSKFEVTERLWHQVMVFINPDPSRFKGDNLPVESVSWNEAQFFVRLMSFFGRHHYRLPSESEWEYAARAATTTTRYWGEGPEGSCPYENIADLSLKKTYRRIVSVFADCDDGYVFTAPVGSFKPNPFGLYDILGNVSEWVEDCYVDTYNNAPKDGDAVTAADCANRVVRGGAWRFGPGTMRASDRSYLASDIRNYNVGFRLVRIVAP